MFAPPAVLDVWIQLSDKNADAIVKTLRQLHRCARIVQAVVPQGSQCYQNGQLAVAIGNSAQHRGREFDDCYSRRKEVTIDEVPVLMIGKADLILYKKAVGRPKDMLDVLELEKLD